MDDLKRIWKDTIEYISQHTPTPIPDVPTDGYYESLLVKNKLEDTVARLKAKARHENAPTMIAAKLDLEDAIKSVEELERLPQVSNRFLPGTAEYQQM
ncbi:169_t:CDS:2 [Paraglomus brasilianum]|uniref:169_t:CDS:1 n=1 Tax=Paraglomus brasilianum TaxID=144538 RepID=A0A9N8ZR84_9GLOM|nr:169_t:CDS:2 [Paraglomus brasilianum]